ncbi:DUF6371 domain-containing protein [Mucilaginibacter lappiensis]|uniref:Toprim-like n=1 Tax=Mucilaginibacter lappiensis TaxID=354630 RepID=A0A841JFZ0_9SPHI|nr:DUF6371 domain-containing protein [Mucilaginibacter lappiensis]MBB6126951.1 hypothetical protein [Mucilaginibacter lappiensis]
MKAFKYNLDKSSKKFLCPSCNKKTLVCFKDAEGNFADSKFGRCDREVNCGYFLKPDDDVPVFVPYQRPVEKDPSFVPINCVLPTLTGYEESNFTKWLIARFGNQRITELINTYRFGVDDSSPYTKDWIIFWQYDIHNRVRSGKIVKYCENGRRDKDNSATWYHKRERGGHQVFPDFNLRQCLFGEHLLMSQRGKPIAIVESEKTAMICSLFIEKYVWLSCGGITQLTDEKIAPLRNRTVTLFPDTGSEGKNGDLYINKATSCVYQKENGSWFKTHLIKAKWDDDQRGSKYRSGDGAPSSAYDKWKEKAILYNFNISDHIEKIASDADKDMGLDLADFLLM